jgi:hypothetical protein
MYFSVALLNGWLIPKAQLGPIPNSFQKKANLPHIVHPLSGHNFPHKKKNIENTLAYKFMSIPHKAFEHLIKAKVDQFSENEHGSIFADFLYHFDCNAHRQTVSNDIWQKIAEILKISVLFTQFSEGGTNLPGEHGDQIFSIKFI